MTEEKKSKEPTVKKVKLSTMIGSFLIFILAYIVLVGVMLCFSRYRDVNLIRWTAQIIPYPVAKVGTKLITFSKLEDQLASVKLFYQNQDFSDLGVRIDFSTPDGKKRLKIKEKDILNKLIENKVIEAQANRRGIRLTRDMIDQEVDRKMKEYGSGDDIEKNLERLYGWNLEDFKENIVKPDVYKEKLFEKIKEEDPAYAQARGKIEKAQKEIKDGSDFSVVATKYSEGKSAQNGGELGWFKGTQMIPEVAVAVYSLKKGATSDIVESSIGLHILRLEDEKEEDGAKLVKVSQIFVRTKTFPEWLSEMESATKITIFDREFRWNTVDRRVEFSDQNLNNFEKEILKKNPEDISI